MLCFLVFRYLLTPPKLSTTYPPFGKDTSPALACASYFRDWSRFTYCTNSQKTPLHQSLILAEIPLAVLAHRQFLCTHYNHHKTYFHRLRMLVAIHESQIKSGDVISSYILAVHIAPFPLQYRNLLSFDTLHSMRLELHRLLACQAHCGLLEADTAQRLGIVLVGHQA